MRPAPIDHAGEADPEDPSGERLAGQSAVGWTIEVLPAALEIFAAVNRRVGPVRVPLAGDGAKR
jgi:hypothetical protein